MATKDYVTSIQPEWSKEEERQLKYLAKSNVSPRVIGFKLRKPERRVRSKAFELGVSLQPVNYSSATRF